MSRNDPPLDIPRTRRLARSSWFTNATSTRLNVALDQERPTRGIASSSPIGTPPGSWRSTRGQGTLDDETPARDRTPTFFRPRRVPGRDPGGRPPGRGRGGRARRG